MNKLVNDIIHIIGKIEWLKYILRNTFHSSWKKYVEENHQRNIDAYHKYGLEALRAFHNCMERNDIKYTMAFGSILGAIREHGFIKHDLDIDTFIWIEDYSPCIIRALQEAGFTWLYSYSVDNDKLGKEDTFEYKGVTIDIFYLYPAIDEHPYCCDFIHDTTKTCKPRRVEIPVSRDRKLTLFENLEVFVPANAEEVCAYRYGPNYMKPDPTWDWQQAKNSIVEWFDMKPLTTYIKYPKL